jgi:CubicO group peptidase (beta-lactamase class C family)
MVLAHHMKHLHPRNLLHLLLIVSWLLESAVNLAAADTGSQPAARKGRSSVEATFKVHPQGGDFIRRWLVLGPMVAEAGRTNTTGSEAQPQAFSTDYFASQGGEAAVRPQPGTGVQIGIQLMHWRSVQADRDTVNLAAILGVKEAGVAYAWAEVVAPREWSGLMGLGSDGPVKVWLNGKGVLDRRSSRALNKDDDLVPVRLEKGVNRLLLKAASRSGGWGVCCRFLNQAAVSEQLVSAAMSGATERISLLLTNGASVKATVGPGLTAWQGAKIRGRTEAAKLLEKQGADTKRPLPSPGKTIDWILTRRVSADMPGLALAVVQDSRVVYKQGWGLASLDYRVSITPSTVFHVASVSKQFTAFAIELLAQQGKLSVDDDFRKYLPEMPDFGKTITLRHLLYHTSGLRDQWDLLVLAGWRMDDVITQQDILAMLRRQQELNFLPGEEHLYCNSGYTLLGEIVARVSGKSLVDFTRAEMFQPLGMTNTHFHLDHEEVVPNMAYSYSPGSGGSYKKSVLSYANVGATSLFTTAEDLARWIANFKDAKVGGFEIQRQMQEKGKLNSGKEIDYGFGLAIGELRKARSISHGGADAGYRSYLLWLPEHHFGVAVLSNLGSMDVEGIAEMAAGVFLHPKLAPLPTRNRSATLDPQAKPGYVVNAAMLERYAGKYQGDSGRVISIVREGDHLKGDVSAGSMQTLTPVGEHEFLVLEIKARLVFAKLEAGKATQYTLETSEQKRIYRRVDPADEVTPKLQDYVGNYRSEELEMSCGIQVKEGRLIVQHRRHGEIPLRQNSRDRFNAQNLGLITFERGPDGKVTGLKVTTGRVRNLRFNRQPS